MKTYLPEVGADKKWYLVDADGVVLGRLAVKIANILRGKDKPEFTPHIDNGSYVIVVNAEKVVMTGNKDKNKIYQNYSGYMGGRTITTAKEVREKDPKRMVWDAVNGMVPKNRLGRQVLAKLKIFAGSKHDHDAQDPELIKL